MASGNMRGKFGSFKEGRITIVHPDLGAETHDVDLNVKVIINGKTEKAPGEPFTIDDLHSDDMVEVSGRPATELRVWCDNPNERLQPKVEGKPKSKKHSEE